MNGKDEPTTENQLGPLRQHGSEPDQPLTKGEAAHLFRDLEGPPADQAPTLSSGPFAPSAPSAYRLHLMVKEARQAVAEAHGDQIPNLRHLLALALAKRQEFWVDTCSDADKIHPVAPQVLALYQKHGCGFAVPRAEQVQTILDCLDRALPSWDRDYPELFFRTLELNFPDLLRHQRLVPTNPRVRIQRSESRP